MTTDRSLIVIREPEERLMSELGQVRLERHHHGSDTAVHLEPMGTGQVRDEPSTGARENSDKPIRMLDRRLKNDV